MIAWQTLLLLVALMAVGAVMRPAGQQSDRVINPLSGNPAAVEAGRRLFDQTCQSCHGPAGRGEQGRGPALNTGSLARAGDTESESPVRMFQRLLDGPSTTR